MAGWDGHPTGCLNLRLLGQIATALAAPQGSSCSPALRPTTSLPCRSRARRPSPDGYGDADICLRWSGTIESAVELLREHKIPIVDGPSWRLTADGLPALSIYFRDLDGNLLELMATDAALARDA